ncbi:MAG: STAS domain-containing protein [Planctomycetota bacterium]
MKLSSVEHRAATVFTLQGQFTTDTSGQLRRAVLECLDTKQRDFVIDIKDLESIDSQGLEALLWLQEQSVDRLGQIRLIRCPDYFDSILKMTRLASRFECHDDLDAALESLG